MLLCTGLPCARVTLEDNTVVPVHDLLDLRITEMLEAEQQAMQDHFCWHILRNKINALLSAQQASLHSIIPLAVARLLPTLAWSCFNQG